MVTESSFIHFNDAESNPRPRVSRFHSIPLDRTYLKFHERFNQTHEIPHKIEEPLDLKIVDQGSRLFDVLFHDPSP